MPYYETEGNYFLTLCCEGGFEVTDLYLSPNGKD
jgi:hypothetical protein